ncbi:MAG: type III secretion inner membrane ring lipoprotein SctJ [Rubrivivax sp.]
MTSTSNAARGRRAVLPGALLALAALLGGCSQQALYSQLSERQANEMIAVLQGAGIGADKQAQEGQFSILTASADFPKAVRMLSAQGYPRESFDTMGKVFKKEGFISTPLEERARLVHAMSQEIANTLTSIDCVVTARVHLVVPEKHPLIDKVQPAAAAVFIKHRPDCDLSPQTTQIKALVVNSIEGLAYDNVTVAMFPAGGVPTEAPTPTKPTAATWAAAALPLMVGTGAGTFALAGGGLLWWRRRRGPVRPGPAALTGGDVLPALPHDFEAALRRRSAAAD